MVPSSPPAPRRVRVWQQLGPCNRGTEYLFRKPAKGRAGCRPRQLVFEKTATSD